MDPFIQHITSYETAPQVVGSSNISARIIFETGVSPTGRINPRAYSQTPGAFSSLLTQGLYFDGNLSDTFSRNALQLRPPSSGGNVSFGFTETLAICSECANITSQLPPPEKYTTGSDNYTDYCEPPDGLCWRWTLPNLSSTGWSHFGDRSTMVIKTDTDSEPIVLNNRGRLVILNLTVILPTWTFTSQGPPPVAIGQRGAAQECSLYWCVNKYNSSLNGGVLDERLAWSFSEAHKEPDVTFYSLKPPNSNASLYRKDSQAYGDNPINWINGTFLVNTYSHTLVHSYLARLLSGNAVSLDYYDMAVLAVSPPAIWRLYSKVWWEGPENTTQFEMQGFSMRLHWE